MVMHLWNNLELPNPQGSCFEITNKEKEDSSLIFPKTSKDKCVNLTTLNKRLLEGNPKSHYIFCLFVY